MQPEENSSKISIFVADDHPIVREGLIGLLSTQSDFLVVGEAANGREVLLAVPEAKPDVILLDLEMPELDGVETLQALSKLGIPIKAIVFTAFDADDRILGAIRAGAQGYLLKDTPRETIFQAIRIVSQGGSLLQPVVASKLLQHVSEVGESDGNLVVEDLTKREMEVLELLGQGLPNKVIAQKLVITERTVKFHVSSILGKLGVSNRTEAVTRAVQVGILKLG